jgi:hypothetical protein
MFAAAGVWEDVSRNYLRERPSFYRCGGFLCRVDKLSVFDIGTA